MLRFLCFPFCPRNSCFASTKKDSFGYTICAMHVVVVFCVQYIRLLFLQNGSISVLIFRIVDVCWTSTQTVLRSCFRSNLFNFLSLYPLNACNHKFSMNGTIVCNRRQKNLLQKPKTQQLRRLNETNVIVRN